MHHGQTGGKRKRHKVCKNQVNFTKSGGKFEKEGNNNFPEIGGMYYFSKIGGEFKILSQ